MASTAQRVQRSRFVIHGSIASMHSRACQLMKERYITDAEKYSLSYVISNLAEILEGIKDNTRMIQQKEKKG